MSLNWKEIDLILTELDLPGAQIQKVTQGAYDVLGLQLYKAGRPFNLLISLTPGACRLHETFRGVPKSDKPLRFPEFLKSRIIGGRIEEACQLGQDRIVRIILRRGEMRFRLYLRLWSNAANLVVTDEDGTVLDAMRRSPKRGEVSGGRYTPEEELERRLLEGRGPPERDYEIRALEGEGSFNEKLDAWYAAHGGALSLDALRERARRFYEGKMGRLTASLGALNRKREDYKGSERLREYGDILKAHLWAIPPGSPWFEAENFYGGGTIRIKLDPKKNPAANAEVYYDQYRKAKSGLGEVEREIHDGERELVRLEGELGRLLLEDNPLRLHKALRSERRTPKVDDKKRPGLSFRRKDWLLIVGRDGAENDELLRRHVRGSDLWLHARDYPGSYVFIKARAGKSFPLEALLDAGNLALFYSKGRNAGEGDLFYTPVKYLRRAKNGPKGLVIPTQEKNLRIKLDEDRLRDLERCRDDI